MSRSENSSDLDRGRRPELKSDEISDPSSLSYRDNLTFVRDRWEIIVHLLGARPHRKGPLYFVKLYVRRVPRTATGSWRLAAIRANWFHTIQSARAMM
jgi:hypothetical protein